MSTLFVRLFQPQFAPLVEAGTKLQTIRKTPKRMPRPGDTISLRQWTGQPYRSPQRILREAKITRVQHIDIDQMGTWLDDIRIKTLREADGFAKADGFGCYKDLMDWFLATHGLPFSGIVIHWEPKILAGGMPATRTALVGEQQTLNRTGLIDVDRPSGNCFCSREILREGPCGCFYQRIG